MDFGGFWICYSTINSASNDTIFCFLPFISVFGPFWTFNSRTNMCVTASAFTMLSVYTLKKKSKKMWRVYYITAKKWLIVEFAYIAGISMGDQVE